MKLIQKIFLLICLFLVFFGKHGKTQIKLSGTVYDAIGINPLEGVSVLLNTGKGTLTAKDGYYEILVNAADSIWFSYLNKPTIKYAVADISDISQFNIALLVNIPVLKEVKIFQRSYKLDSIQNRIEYAKIFNYEKPKFRTIVTSLSPLGVTIDIQELIRVFQFREKRNMLSFQKRLLQQEMDKYIDRRFSKTLVRALTGLDSCKLDTFMILFRPTYDIILLSSDYEFQEYIKKAFDKYKTLEFSCNKNSE